MIIPTSESVAITASPAASLGRDCVVTVVIKALNEEKRIEVAIESALAAVAGIGGEVVLADSCSTDRTIELASRYPIRIVQLSSASERCCGVGPQLGYQHSSGEFVYILDGDMQMLDGFLPKAVEFLRQHPEFAGVAGQVVEMNTHSLEYVSRMERSAGHMQAGAVDRLDMGGLYRRAAVEQVGYLSDRNLHSYEEFDLAVRLRSQGWKLHRIAVDAVRHHGHDAPPYALLARRWRTAYICGLGELLRSAWGKPQMGLIVAEMRELKLYLAMLLWWLVALSVWLWPVALAVKALIFTGMVAAPFIAMTLKKKSLAKGVFSVVSWGFNVAGLVRGLAMRRKPAQAPVASVLLWDKA